MGRVVSCKHCGAWGEVPPDASTAGWLCEKCGGAAAGASRPGRAAAHAEGESSRGISIGHDSGLIGSSAFGLGAPGLDEQMQQMRDAVSRIKIGTADVDEVSKRLSAAAQSGIGAATLGTGAAAGAAVGIGAGLAARAAQAAKAGTYELADQATEFARAQADKTLADAQQLLEEKGVKAVPEARDFLRGEVQRIGHEARSAAEQKVHEASERATAAAREALGQARAKVQRVVLRPETPPGAGVCGLCSERIIAGDRVTICPNCGTKYHANCYNLVGHCASQQCRAQQASAPGSAGAQAEPGAKPVFPATPVGEPTVGPGAGAAPRVDVRRCAGCGTRIGDKTLVCPQCGRWVTKDRHPGPGAQTNKLPVGCVVAIILVAIFFLLILVMSSHGSFR